MAELADAQDLGSCGREAVILYFFGVSANSVRTEERADACGGNDVNGASNARTRADKQSERQRAEPAAGWAAVA